MEIDKEAQLSLDFKVSDGNINSDISITGKFQRNHLRGDYNGGGAKLRASTSDGDITIHTK